MKNILKTLSLIMAVAIVIASCKKNSVSSTGKSPMAGFWTYKTNVADPNKYWNCNALFKSNGTFRMYTALSLADTAAAQAIADTSSQVVTVGTYTVSGNTVKMLLSEFGSIGINFEGSVNSSFNSFFGTGDVSSDPNSATVSWFLTKP